MDEPFMRGVAVAVTLSRRRMSSLRRSTSSAAGEFAWKVATTR
ncbi:MAG TPA: hypothetical protein VFO01_05785 [Trebonia sp.]|nr:hypothetical protein [Trebonia sp.]